MDTSGSKERSFLTFTFIIKVSEITKIQKGSKIWRKIVWNIFEIMQNEKCFSKHGKNYMGEKYFAAIVIFLDCPDV